MAQWSYESTERLNSLDFCLGTLLGAEDQRPNLFLISNDRRVDAGFFGAYTALRGMVESGETDIELGFTVRPHFLHGDSQVVQDAMAYLANPLKLLKQSDYSRKHYRLDLRLYQDNPATAFASLRIPGDFPFWQNLGGIFIEHHDGGDRS